VLLSQQQLVDRGNDATSEHVWANVLTTEGQSMPDTIEQNAAIEKGLAELSQNPIQQLRQRWRTMFRTDPPAAFGPDLLRRSIAQRIQEQHYGGLSVSAQRQLNQVVKAMASKPDGRIELPRRIKTGAVLVRTWKDKSHRVTVLDDGFSFEDRTYSSLSEIAREITGTRWSGPKFFGLRATIPMSSDRTDSPMLGNASPQGGRPPAACSDLFNFGMEVGHGL
jgi:hypothetical protein